MRLHCSCPKWFNKLDLDGIYTLIYKYITHPKYGMAFSIHQPCFMCRNEDRIEDWSVNEFRYSELFDPLPHPETLNLYFVGSRDYPNMPRPPVMPEKVSVQELIMLKQFDDDDDDL